jgi:hypothetical protein
MRPPEPEGGGGGGGFEFGVRVGSGCVRKKDRRTMR